MDVNLKTWVRWSMGAAVLALGLGASAAWARSPHFQNLSASCFDEDTLAVSGKDVGLGLPDNSQVTVVVTADAQCVNPGNNAPKANNKNDTPDVTAVEAQGIYFVSSGNLQFSINLDATMTPSCNPPMTIDFTNVQVCAYQYYPGTPLNCSTNFDSLYSCP
ncbi:hypothetical protein [Anaeromyxobacter sp. SG26]|uniref:hypothetical protein n=1 Tax=Anaeromyxobacter sp. SG26 TaxID=2925407 RepID=UPI001F57DF0F|nr:hypothetical protein [Anaeromyxobacter sp. SG26]